MSLSSNVWKRSMNENAFSLNDLAGLMQEISCNTREFLHSISHIIVDLMASCTPITWTVRPRACVARVPQRVSLTGGTREDFRMLQERDQRLGIESMPTVFMPIHSTACSCCYHFFISNSWVLFTSIVTFVISWFMKLLHPLNVSCLPIFLYHRHDVCKEVPGWMAARSDDHTFVQR